MSISKRILFITTHNLATNPRLVKEIYLALKNHFSVSVICFEFDNWSKQLNEQIKRRLLPVIKYYPVSGNRKPLLPWALSSIFQLSSKKLLKFFPKNIFLLSVMSSKRSWLLLNELKKIHEPIHLVVAHNPGSFYPAMVFAKKKKIPFGIDLEDYHPGETNNTKSRSLSKTLQNLILPNAEYISAASPLILEYAQKDCEIDLKNSVVDLNYFPSNEFIPPATKENGKLKLVWFSQQISFDRGLEQVIPLITNNDAVELHLFGNCNEAFKIKCLTGIDNIFVHSALSQNELHNKLSEFDIGLAIESSNSNLNRNICITNKMLAYFQAGLYILASDTKAQKQFIKSHPESGCVAELDSKSFGDALNELVQQKKSIRDSAPERFEKVQDFCWEEESKKLLKAWEMTCS